MCEVLGVSPSGYYAWRRRGQSARAEADEALLTRIRAIHARSRGTYGSPRVHAELHAQGVCCSRKRVARLMRADGLSGVRQPRRDRVVAPNHLNRDFTAQAPNRVWLSDFSYIRTWEGWLFLAVVLDLFSRKVVGWAMGNHPTDALTRQALQMALRQRRPTLDLLVHHSDQGPQYTSHTYLKPLVVGQAVLSMSRTGDCFDNAPIESFFATLKTELTHRTPFLTRTQARAEIFDYLETFYNPVRRHSSLDYRSPDDFERSHAD